MSSEYIITLAASPDINKSLSNITRSLRSLGLRARMHFALTKIFEKNKCVSQSTQNALKSIEMQKKNYPFDLKRASRISFMPIGPKLWALEGY